MIFRLHTGGLDEDEAIHDFDTMDEALAWASWWFLSGYWEKSTFRVEEREIIADAGRLMDDLRAGREFVRSSELDYDFAHIKLVDPAERP